MQILKKDERAQLKTRPLGKVSLIRLNLLKLEVGEALKVEPADWKQKRKNPTALCQRLEKHSTLRFKVEKLLEGEGWVVERVK